MISNLLTICLHSKLKSGEKISEEELVGELDGNICRCTGYRSIIDAAKSLAATDIEVLNVYIELFKVKYVI